MKSTVLLAVLFLCACVPPADLATATFTTTPGVYSGPLYGASYSFATGDSAKPTEKGTIIFFVKAPGTCDVISSATPPFARVTVSARSKVLPSPTGEYVVEAESTRGKHETQSGLAASIGVPELTVSEVANGTVTITRSAVERTVGKVSGSLGLPDGGSVSVSADFDVPRCENGVN